MQEFLDWYLGWYGAPWRKVNRLTFNLVLGLVTLPGLILGFSGLLGGAGGVLGPALDMLSLGQQVQGGSPVDPAALTRLLSGPDEAGVVAAPGIDWGSLLDALTMLALLPLVQMRLRDLGKGAEAPLWTFTGLVYLPVVNELCGLAGMDTGAAGTLAGVMGFVVLGWLCLAAGKPAATAETRASAVTGRQGFGMVAPDETRTHGPDPQPRDDL